MKAVWLVLGVVLGLSIYPIIIDAVEYYGSIPPTVAVRSITPNDTINTIGSPADVVTMQSYAGNLNLGSDGSIKIVSRIGFP